MPDVFSLRHGDARPARNGGSPSCLRNGLAAGIRAALRPAPDSADADHPHGEASVISAGGMADRGCGPGWRSGRG